MIDLRFYTFYMVKKIYIILWRFLFSYVLILLEYVFQIVYFS